MSPEVQFRFFLGGRDLEMIEIRKLLNRHAPDRIEDRGLAWGAKISAYHEELLISLRRGETPVLIELEDDLAPGLFDRSRIVVVDHHGPLAGHDRPTSIEQIFKLLQLPPGKWTRHLALVAANDRAHVAGMRAIGATAAEIAEIRAADRAAQGISEADEAEAVRAITARHCDGRVTLVETASGTSSVIADRMLPELDGPGYDRLLVVMPNKLAAFADGAAIKTLAREFPKSWWGGDLPLAGYWGMDMTSDSRPIIQRLINILR